MREGNNKIVGRERNFIRVGFDLDGVLCTEFRNNWLIKFFWKIFPKTWSFITHLFAKKTEYCNAVYSGDYVITGRPSNEFILTRRQLDKWGLKNVLLIIDYDKNKPDKQKSIAFKIDKIKKLGIDLFYENDLETIKELKKNTSTKTIYVHN